MEVLYNGLRCLGVDMGVGVSQAGTARISRVPGWGGRAMRSCRSHQHPSHSGGWTRRRALGWGAVMGRHYGCEQGRKLSVRPHRAITNFWVVVALAAAGALAPLSSAAASSLARPQAVRAPSAAVVAAASANRRIAFSQWDLLPGGNLSGHSNVYTINPDGSGRRQLTHVGAARAAGADWTSCTSTTVG